MSSCEVCGAERVAVRRLDIESRVMQICKQCSTRMGREWPEPSAKASRSDSRQLHNRQSRRNPSNTGRFSGGYGGRGEVGKDIMAQGDKELADDFATRIRENRIKKGWDQKKLAGQIAEKVNVIQRLEQGVRPTDSVIRKLERVLEVSLYVLRKSDADTHPGDRAALSRGMTLGDFMGLDR